MKHKLFLSLMALFFFIPVANAIDTHDTRMLSQPALSQDQIAFVYANDIWSARLDGGNPRKLTSHPGTESNPCFSPDGKSLAFTGDYDGNSDIFIIPAAGGIPKRLTWHPSYDAVRGFTPDGKFVLFTSSRNSFGLPKLYKVPVEGGFQEEYPVPYVTDASFSPDQLFLAYNPNYEAFSQWKNYRGGRNSEIWICRMSDYSVEKIQQPKDYCNDVDPLWSDNKVIFRSDRNGEFNIFIYDTQSKVSKQLTTHEDYPVMGLAVSGKMVLYDQAGYLHLMDLSTGQSNRLVVGIATDLPEIRERYVKGDSYIRSFSPSPSGSRAVFEFRGDIVTLPAEKGDPRNITSTQGYNERSPMWSPDGKSIAYFSDEKGEYQLVITRQDGSGIPKFYPLIGGGFYYSLQWSPDNQKITFNDNSSSRYWIDIKTGKVTKIGSDYYYQIPGFKNNSVSWSADSRWIAYTLNNAAWFQQILIYSIDQNKSFPVTDGLSEASEPEFDASGKYLWFFSSTNAGPVNQWFDQSKADMKMNNNIYLAVLRKGIESPLMKESDEEKPKEDTTSNKTETAKPPKKSSKDKVPADTTAKVNIDFDGLNNRIISVPVPAGYYWNLQAGKEGQIYFQEEPKAEEGRIIGFSGEKGKVHQYDLKTRKDEVILTDASIFLLTNDKQKILYQSGETFGIVNSTGKNQSGDGKLNTSSIEVKIYPELEWKQIFTEVWRINRDYFYDPGMQGADWTAMKQKYEVFLPHLASRNDLGKVITWLCSELSVGHSFYWGGDFLYKPQIIKGGLLGADYAIENGRYRIKKIISGINWTPDLRSPLTEPGVDGKEGEYILAVNGKELVPPEDLYSRFENTADKIVELLVGPSPDGTGSRKVKVVPQENEYDLRFRDWVEGNLKKVEQATAGKVAYVYVPNTAQDGYNYFKRYFYPQVDKQAIIVDERFNGGGSIADYYIDILRRPYISMWAMRYGADFKTPGSSIQGPKVMLINEYAGSGGDLLPWMFRKFGLGKLIGKRTWGGLVGILGFPQLLDGAVVTAPNLAIWTKDGWIVENKGIDPDIEVEQWPAEMIKGADPQLDKAISVILDELKNNPQEELKRPSYPVRVRKH